GDRGDLAIADHSRGLYVLVDQTFHREDKLIIERRFRMLGQAADAYMDLVHPVEFRGTVHREDGHHAGREAAVGDYADACGFRIGVKGKLSVYDVVVAAEVAERRAAFYRGPR